MTLFMDRFRSAPLILQEQTRYSGRILIHNQRRISSVSRSQNEQSVRTCKSTYYYIQLECTEQDFLSARSKLSISLIHATWNGIKLRLGVRSNKSVSERLLLKKLRGSLKYPVDFSALYTPSHKSFPQKKKKKKSGKGDVCYAVTLTE